MVVAEVKAKPEVVEEIETPSHVLPADPERAKAAAVAKAKTAESLRLNLI